MRYHLFQKFFGKMVEIKEMSFLSTRGMGLMFGNCILIERYKPFQYFGKKYFFCQITFWPLNSLGLPYQYIVVALYKNSFEIRRAF